MHPLGHRFTPKPRPAETHDGNATPLSLQGNSQVTFEEATSRVPLKNTPQPPSVDTTFQEQVTAQAFSEKDLPPSQQESGGSTNSQNHDKGLTAVS